MKTQKIKATKPKSDAKSNKSDQSLKSDQTQIKIVTLDNQNIMEQGCRCFMNVKDESHMKKIQWVQAQLGNGLKIKNLWHQTEKKPIGFIETIPGENAWRAVDAKEYLFIHCIWISPNKYKDQGYASLLIQDSITEAKKLGKKGMAVVTSKGSFMASKDIFFKNRFELIETDDRFELLALKFEKIGNPRFNDWRKALQSVKDFQIFYSEQCPWVIRSIAEITEFMREHQIACTITKLEVPNQAQAAPSIYSTFIMVKKGKILVDHYVSFTRFQTLLKENHLLK